MLDLISFIGSMASIFGVSAKDFQGKGDKQDIEAFITYLEKKRVLYAEIDREDRDAVITSLQSIKEKVEDLRANSRDRALQKILGKLVTTMSKVLDDIWSCDKFSAQGQMKMYLALQKFRTDMARVLSILCHGYGIPPQNSELQALIVNMATVRPRNT